jgi:hypothetical protein
VTAGELIYPPAKSKADTPPVDAVKGFVFVSGIRWMERHGVIEQYTQHLPEHLRASMHMLGASAWVPLEDSLAVYAACDALALGFEEQIDVGRFVATANNGVVVSTVLRLIGPLGSPWLALSHTERLWHRSNRGGGVAVYKLGERSARLDFFKVPLARSRFFVVSMRGAVAAGLEAFCDRCVVTELSCDNAEEFVLKATW